MSDSRRTESHDKEMDTKLCELIAFASKLEER